MSDPRVVLHIGSTKTGSSALQAALHERREDLAAGGVHYSARGVAAGAHHVLAASIHPGAWRMHADDLPEDRAAFFEETAQAIRADAAAANAHTICLSSEYFWGSFAPPVYKTFAAAFAPLPVEVVAFVRDPQEWVTSSYLQAVKSGEARDFDEWFQLTMTRWGSGLHYFRVINRWNIYLSARRVHVIRYGEAKDNVFKSFADALGLSISADTPPKQVNPSPSADGVSRLLEINRSDLEPDEKAALRKTVMRAHRSQPGADLTGLLSPATRAEVARLSALSGRLIGRTFLSGEPLLYQRPGALGANESPAAAELGENIRSARSG